MSLEPAEQVGEGRGNGFGECVVIGPAKYLADPRALPFGGAQATSLANLLLAVRFRPSRHTGVRSPRNSAAFKLPAEAEETKNAVRSSGIWGW